MLYFHTISYQMDLGKISSNKCVTLTQVKLIEKYYCLGKFMVSNEVTFVEMLLVCVIMETKVGGWFTISEATLTTF